MLRLQIQRYQLLREKLDDLIAHKIFSLEAAQRGVSVQQFVHDEISAKIQTVTPEQVQAFYEANKNRIKQPLEKVSEQITSYLQQQAQDQRRQSLLKELRSRYPVTVALRAPGGDCDRGRAVSGACQCASHDRRIFRFSVPLLPSGQGTLKQLMAAYEGKIKLVFRDFPLRNIHPQAQKAAEAAQCAAEQQNSGLTTISFSHLQTSKWTN